MLRLVLSTLRARKARALLAAAAITLGVAFMSATLVLTDTLGNAYDNITTSATTGTDAVVRSDQALTGNNDTTVRGRVDDAVLSTVAQVDGVRVAEPDVQGIAQLVRSDGTLVDANPNRATPLAMGWHDTEALNPLRLVTGHAPGAHEVVIDRRTARMGDLHVGDAVGILTATGSGHYSVAGIATYGGANDAAGAHFVAFAPATAATVLGAAGEFDSIRVVADPAVAQEQIATRIRDALAHAGVQHVEAITGAALTQEAKDKAHEDLAFLAFFLTAFAAVSLLVGSMVIANAFAITAAQRTRENALLRALGAGRGQVTRTVVTEALVTGAVASWLGVLLGIGTARLLQTFLEGFGLALPDGPLAIRPQVFILGMLVGTLVTVLASYLPARRAGRTAPVAALRTAAEGATRRLRWRAAMGTLLAIVGAALVAIGLTGGTPAPAGIGSLVCFAGLVSLGPVIAPWIVRTLGEPLARLTGITGVLARQNAHRNPRRTAATASSLMIGLGLVSFTLVLGTSARASFADVVDHGLRGDWIVSTVFGQGGVTPELAQRIDQLPETGAVSALRYTVGQIDQTTVDISAIDTATAEQVMDNDVRAGQFAAVGLGDIAIRSDVARTHGWRLGDRITVAFPRTGDRRLIVRAVYDALEPLGPYSIAMSTYRANVADSTDRFVFIADAPGVSRDDARRAITRVLAAYPTTKLQTGPEFASDASKGISQMLNMMNMLLALAVLIALFGIMNTLALSVHERTRELGLLRAVGMDRQQVRATVRYEALIVSLFGTLTGLVTGTGIAAALVQTLHNEGVDRVALPLVPLLGVVAVGAVAGVVCATFPARRGSRIDVLRALHAD